MPLDSPCGVFIVGFETRGVATVTALDAGGQPILNREGAAEWLVVDDFLVRDVPDAPPGAFKSTPIFEGDDD